MSKSSRARRMARNHRRMKQPARLNLVALMDIFTILVLFLIVNNSDVEVLQPDQRIALPDSVSEQRPDSTLVVRITERDIWVGQDRVMGVEQALDSPGQTLLPLAGTLGEVEIEASLLGDTAKGHAIVIMGDQSTPYALLKRVLATSAEAGFRDVSLAVDSRPLPAGAIAPVPGQLAATGGVR